METGLTNLISGLKILGRNASLRSTMMGFFIWISKISRDFSAISRSATTNPTTPTRVQKLLPLTATQSITGSRSTRRESTISLLFRKTKNISLKLRAICTQSLES